MYVCGQGWIGFDARKFTFNKVKMDASPLTSKKVQYSHK